MKKALITGITGQDGSYLAELLLKKEVGPCLCHGDASDVNIIVDKTDKGYNVKGIIDFLQSMIG